MTRDEALKLLGGGPEGIAEWNRRREKGESIPDLSGAKLSGAKLGWANLNMADLSGADLFWARLRDACLSGADLSEAHLSGADLRGAHLSEADLRGADLSEADLRGADLSGADLGLAHLSGADLRGADLRTVTCGGTLFTDVDLSQIQGLELIRHVSPSEIGVSTLIRSKGKIPEGFLRGCGVPDSLIAYLPALIGSMQPIQFYSCFISYSSKDEDFARRLHSRMREEGLRVWFAPEEVQGGKKLHEQIDEAIRVFDKLLLVLSPNSMQSEWVATEIRRARKAEREENRRKLFPIRLVPFEAIQDWECFDIDSRKDMGVEVREYFVPDFTNWKDHDSFEKAFDRLLRDLKAEVSPAK